MKPENDNRFYCEIPIIIPTLRRIHPHKPKKEVILCLVACLRDLFKHYYATNVHVIAQEYLEEERESMEREFPLVHFHWHEKRMGIIGTFNKVRELGCELGPWYIHYDDDVEMSSQFSENPTLLAYEAVMKLNPNRVGAVSCTSTSLIHFAKNQKELIKLMPNPAQLILINTKAAKQCMYDSRFEHFKSDTDFTMQMAEKKFIPLALSKYFSFTHTIPLARVVTDSVTGKKSFQVNDNVSIGKSVGGIRTDNRREYEYTEMNLKWPLVRTAKNFKFQVLKDSIVHLSGFRESELLEYESGFDYSLIRNVYEPFYKKEKVINAFTDVNSLF